MKKMQNFGLCLDLRSELNQLIELYKNDFEGDLISHIENSRDVYVIFERNLFRSVFLDLIDYIMNCRKGSTFSRKLLMIDTSLKRLPCGRLIIILSIKNYNDIDNSDDYSDGLPRTFVRIEQGGLSVLRNRILDASAESHLRVLNDEQIGVAKMIIKERGGSIHLMDNFLLGRGGGISFEWALTVA